MKILVTGGAGYVGSMLCPMLLEAGHDVLLLDNFSVGVKPILHFATNPRLTIVPADVRDEAAVRKAVAQADAIIHLAAVVGYPACAADPTLALTTNVDGTRNICNATGKNQMLVFASTGSTYGQVDGEATEETPINPLTLYGRTKRDAESLIVEKGGVGLRFATVFGVSPRLRLDLLVNDFCYQAYHKHYLVIFESRHRRTFLHVWDAAQSYLLTINRYSEMAGQVYNVGAADLNYTKKEVALTIQKHLAFHLHEADVGEDLDKRDYSVCYRKISALGYRAAISMDEGVRGLLKIVPHISDKSEWRNA